MIKMNITKLQTTAAVLLAFGAAVSGASAQTYAKSGLTGNVPGNSQITQGLGSLTEITGTFDFETTGSERSVRNSAFPDLFEIFIDGSSPFSATTLGQPSSVYDTQLFLFDFSGNGLYANDDASDFSKGSLIFPTVNPNPGLYYLGVATYGTVARSGPGAASDIFDNTIDDTSGAVSFTGLKEARPGSGPLTQWFRSTANVETGSYSIALTGASFAVPPVPEASTTVSLALLLALGLGGMTVAARRKKAQVSG